MGGRTRETTRELAGRTPASPRGARGRQLGLAQIAWKATLQGGKQSRRVSFGKISADERDQSGVGKRRRPKHPSLRDSRRSGAAFFPRAQPGTSACFRDRVRRFQEVSQRGPGGFATFAALRPQSDTKIRSSVSLTVSLCLLLVASRQLGGITRGRRTPSPLRAWALFAGAEDRLLFFWSSSSHCG